MQSNTYLTQEQKEARILPLIAEQKQILADAGNPTREEAEVRAAEYEGVDIMESLAAIMDKNGEAGEAEFIKRRKLMDAWQEASKAKIAYNQIDRLQESLEADLVDMSGAKYIVFQVTGKGLKSPAGWHPDTNVFVMDRDVILGVQDLKQVPRTNFELAYIMGERD